MNKLLLALVAMPLLAQESPLLNSRDFLTLTTRIQQLAESTSITAPGLSRAAAPMIEDLKQDVKSIQIANRSTISNTYAVLTHARSYLALSEGMPKQFPFLAAGMQQFTELRQGVDRLEIHFRQLLSNTEMSLRGSDRDNLKRYSEANRTVPPATPGRVLFFGDSITDGWRLNEYFPGKDYVNRGISGQITGEMLGRMMADVIANKPAALLVLAGTNDIARGVEVETIKNNLTAISELADHHKIKVILASILPVSDHHKNENPRFEMTVTRPPAVISQLNTWISAFCKQHGHIYLNYFDAMVDSTGQLRAELANDGLHPNAEGYKIMAPLAQAAIDKALPGKSPQQVSTRKRQ